MKFKTTLYYSLSIVIVMVIASCKKDKPATIYQGYDYFPNRASHWIIYNVDSISANPQKSRIDTFTYQIKEVIDSFYTDNTGARTQVIIRYKRKLPDSIWAYQKTYTGNLTSTQAIRTEDGIKFVKLAFPVSVNASWNGGAYNNSVGANAVFPDWNQTNFQYTSVNSPLYLNWQNFDSCVTVLQLSNQNQIQYQYFVEEYAVNIGRIYKEIINVTTPTSYPWTVGFDPNHPGQDSIWVQADYPYLILTNELAQGSVVYTETYVSSGN